MPSNGDHPRSRGFLQFLVSFLRLSYNSYHTRRTVLSSCMTLALWKCHYKSLSDLSNRNHSAARQFWGGGLVPIWQTSVTWGSISSPDAVCMWAGGRITCNNSEEQMCFAGVSSFQPAQCRLALQMNCYRQPFCLLQRSLPIKAGHSTSLFQHY